ncbi:hypothetical protein LPW33_14860 [Ectothiorhodospira variabilis]|nr:hypothetical protein [Ectothiorhodospira variabilis]MCG5495753.1 hypothetical protein [Ectothiorhodospira variabilis]MCG5505220.1 hypothetical protein [Ectothiorhodospira variabilis]MCG5508343.1 hypothetical protein [Ectothiorhodospira variabilis]
MIELIIVIIIIAILALTAVPRFTEVTEDARQSTIQNAASQVTLWNVSNYNRYLRNTDFEEVTNCTEALALAVDDDNRLSSDFILGGTNDSTDGSTTGARFECSITRNDSDYEASFDAIYVADPD